MASAIPESQLAHLLRPKLDSGDIQFLKRRKLQARGRAPAAGRRCCLRLSAVCRHNGGGWVESEWEDEGGCGAWG